MLIYDEKIHTLLLHVGSFSLLAARTLPHLENAYPEG